MTDSPSPEAALARRRPWLAAFAAINAIAAWGGAIALVSGATDFGQAIDTRFPFENARLAGVALAIIVGLPLTALATSAWRSSPRTDLLALATGSMLIGWILGQLIVIAAFSVFQPLYLGVGIALIVAAGGTPGGGDRRGAIGIVTGAVVGAVGARLIGNPIDDGLTMTSILAMPLLLGGAAMVVTGWVWTTRNYERRTVRSPSRLNALITSSGDRSSDTPALSAGGDGRSSGTLTSARMTGPSTRTRHPSGTITSTSARIVVAESSTTGLAGVAVRRSSSTSARTEAIDPPSNDPSQCR